MKVHVLQHVVFEGIGSIATYLEEQKAEVTYTRFDRSDPLPEVDAFDLVIAMGGPMSVNDEALYPWLIEEKRFIREAVAKGVAVLGICLGSQLIASALGARVYPAPHPEIGWFDIHSTGPAESAFPFPEKMKVFHWHGETFDLPERAVRLAGSDACLNQAFQVSRNVIGLQCHLETTPEGIEAMLTNCGSGLTPAPSVQPVGTIRQAPHEDYVRANRLMVEVLSFLVAQAAA